MAFLAGTRGSGSDTKIKSNTNFDELKNTSCVEDKANAPVHKLQVNQILINSGTKSAFRKVHQQLSTHLGVLKENEVANTKPSSPTTYINIGLTNKEETSSNKNNKRSDNNSSPIEEKDNDINCLIGPNRVIQSMEARVTNIVISRACFVIYS